MSSLLILLPIVLFVFAPISSESIVATRISYSIVYHAQTPSMKIYGFDSGSNEAKLFSASSFSEEWSLSFKYGDVFTLALLYNNSSYYIVAGNGDDLWIVNSSGSVVRFWSLSESFGFSHPTIYTFGFLGSNLTHVYSAVSLFYSDFGIGFQQNYHLSGQMLMVTLNDIVLSSEKIVSRYSFPSRYMQLNLLGRFSENVFSKNLMPSMRSKFGNISTFMFPLVFYVNGFRMFMIDESESNYVDMDTLAGNLTYLADDILPNVDGIEVIVALNSTESFVKVYSLVNSSGELMYDENNSRIIKNLRFSGETIDIATYDIDGDSLNELLVENDTKLVILGVDQDDRFYVNNELELGEIDKLVVGSFIENEPEFAFYDYANSKLEIWNMSNELYSMNVDYPHGDIVVSDIDSDGYDDIVFAAGSSVYFVYGRGLNATYDVGSNISSNILLADIDGDDNLELMVATNDTLWCIETTFDGVGNIQYVNPLGVRAAYITDSDLDGIKDSEELILGFSPYDPSNKRTDLGRMLIDSVKRVIRLKVALLGQHFSVRKVVSKLLLVIKSFSFSKIQFAEYLHHFVGAFATIVRRW